ncbi:uncharacterized protein LOC143730836 [Siphateles boraxobius]|uniref:uncharacterized protein LOC143730836 n=1 Tax=Siphateles boraxobius TaxID=180520 RepID=UPI004062D88F
MERRVFSVFCVMAVLGSVSSQAPATPKLSIVQDNMTLVCAGRANFEQPKFLTDNGASGHFTCCSEDDEPAHICLKAQVKILNADNLIQLDMSALITVLVSDVLVTVLIGWAVYTICAQPSTGTGYQDSKASDKKSLIPHERVSNNTPGDAYQRLNTRSDEYSTLQGQRKPKDKRHPI